MATNTISSADAIKKHVDIYLAQGYELKSITNNSAELVCYYKWTWRDTLIFIFCGIIGPIVLAIFMTDMQTCYLNIYDSKVVASGCTIEKREKGNPNKKPFFIVAVIGFIIVLCWFLFVMCSSGRYYY